MDRVNNGTQGANNSFVNGTVLDAEWNQNLQEELIGIIEDAGLTPDSAQQGQILEAVNLKASIGVNQTWQDVTASRTDGVTYTNESGRPIFVTIKTTGSVDANVSLYAGAIEICLSQTAGSSRAGSVVGIIPNGSTYRATAGGNALTWHELR